MTQLGLESLRPGEMWELPEGTGTIEFVGLERWASFQIAHDPGKEPALISAALALVGLMLSLFIRRRRVWVRVSAEESGDTVVQVAGLMRSDEGDLEPDVGELVDIIAEGRPVSG